MDFKKISNFKKGLTFTELLIVISLIGIIALFVITVYIAHFKLFSNQVSLIDASSQNKLVLDEMVRQVRQSQAVAAGCCGKTSGEKILVLQLWSINSSGEPVEPSPTPSLVYDNIIYEWDQANKKLLKTTVPSPGSSRTSQTKVLTTNVTSLAFKYYDSAGTEVDPATNPTEVGITITTSVTYGNKTQTFNQEARAYLRN